MTDRKTRAFNDKTDLELERVVDVPAHVVWKAWSRPEHLKHWWAPKPLTTEVLQMDFRPGGVFETVMREPGGKEYRSKGVYLEIVEGRRIVFTDALIDDYRPSDNPFFTGIIEFEDVGGYTRYVATALHRNPEDKATHEKMGFHDGWGTCLNQLVAYTKALDAA